MTRIEPEPHAALRPVQTAEASAHRWLIDPDRSLVEFRVPQFWGFVKVGGRFERFEGGDDGSVIQLTIDAASLDTGNTKRDKHLRSADFFDVDNHPQLRFQSTSIAKTTDGTLRVIGELQAAGETVEIGFDALVHTDGEELELEVETAVDQRLFGMTWSPVGMIRSPATLHVKARLVAARGGREAGAA